MTAPAPLPAGRRLRPPFLRRVTSPLQMAHARGESMLWLAAGGLVLALLMILGLLLLVFGQGIATFWPEPLTRLVLRSGSNVLGEVTRTEQYRPGPELLTQLDPATAAAARSLMAGDGMVRRRLLRTGNFELTNEHFRWVSDFEIAAETNPPWGLVVERQAGGRAYGEPKAFLTDGKAVANAPLEIWNAYERLHAESRRQFERRERIRLEDIGRLSDRQEQARLDARAILLAEGEGSPAHQKAQLQFEQVRTDCAAQQKLLEAEVATIDRELARHTLQLTTADGRDLDLPLAQVVRAYAPNQLDLAGRSGVYFSRWSEFLVDPPRESQTEGGVYPAIFGTVLMTLLMSIAVLPFGVLAALYMREYARSGFLISVVRVAVNNLAGVPSIVFGAFGFGFFCVLIGGSIDAMFYPERLPSPTFGKGALVWASLTLALLTLPVVIVATEEALAAVPRSMREGSYACGASKWQTIRRIVLPRAMPGIMTGAILAMARGAGEVAPLMLVGAVNMASSLPLDAQAPFVHPSRSFMHLGFHIYDLGFQSQNSEAAKPMVYTTTLLLIATVAGLNVLAVWLRSRLRRRFVASQF